MRKPMQELVKTKAMGWKLFKEGSFKVDGDRYLRIPLQIRLSAAFSGVAENGPLPRAGRSGYAEAKAPVVEVYSALQMSALSEAITRAGSVPINTPRDEMKGIATSFAGNLDRMLFGFSSGKIVKVKSVTEIAAPVYTITVATDQTDVFADTAPLFAGMRVAWGTAAELGSGVTGADGHGEVKHVTDSTNFIVEVLDGTTIPAADDYFVCGDDTTHSYGREFVGLREMIDNTATIQGLDPASANYPFWVVNRYQANGGGAAITLQLPHLMAACIKHGKMFDGEPVPDTIVCRPEIAIEYFDILYPNQRFSPGKFAGTGVSPDELDWNYAGKRLKWLYSPKSMANKLLFMERGYFTYGWLEKPGWVTNRNNGFITEPVPGVNARRGYYGAIGQFVTTDRRRITTLEDINHSTL